MKIKLITLASCILLSTLVACNKPEKTAPAKISTDEDKFSYAIGYQVAQSLKQQKIKPNMKIFDQAVDDVLNDKKLQLSFKEMQTAMSNYRKQQMAERASKGEAAKKAGEKFLADNKTKKGVITTASGLQYQVIKEGTGVKPTINDTVVANYRGTLIDGTVFDSSYKRGQPATFPLRNVIKGWQEGLPLMSVGSKYKFFIPSSLGYGARGAGATIGPNEALIFEVELLDIKKPAAKPKKG